MALGMASTSSPFFSYPSFDPPRYKRHCPICPRPYFSLTFNIRTRQQPYNYYQQQQQIMRVSEAHCVTHQHNDYIFLDLLERNEDRHGSLDLLEKTEDKYGSTAIWKIPLKECTASCFAPTVEDIHKDGKWEQLKGRNSLQSSRTAFDEGLPGQDLDPDQKLQMTCQQDVVQQNGFVENLKIRNGQACCNQQMLMTCQEHQVHSNSLDEELYIMGQKMPMFYENKVQKIILEKSPWQILQSVLQIARDLPKNALLSECLDSFCGQIDTECGNEILQRLGNENFSLQALSFFEWMRVQTPCLLNSKSFCFIITILGRAKMADRALTLFRNMPNTRDFHCVNVYNALISALSNNGRYDDALLLLKEMTARSVDPDSITFSLLITCARRNGQSLTEVWKIFVLMNEKQIHPNITLFGSLIKAFCDEGLRKEALLISREMERQGFTLNVIIYNTLIDAYGKEMLLEEVEGLLLEMRENGVRPSVSTYNALIDAYGRRGKCEVAELLLLEMQGYGLLPDVVSYSTLITAYGRQQQSEKAASVFLRMKKSGIHPNAQAYTALIHAYSEGKWHKKAETAFENMLREGLTPTTETYTALLDAYRQAGDLEKLMHYWKMMRKGNCGGTRVTFNILLDAFAKKGFYTKARDVIFEFTKLGFKPDRLTYNMLINAYGRGGQHVKIPAILEEMIAAGFSPDSFTFTTVIYSFLRVRDFTQAFRYYELMCKQHQQPDRATYMKLRALLDAKHLIKKERDQKSVLGQPKKQKGLWKEGKKAKRFWKRCRLIHKSYDV